MKPMLFEHDYGAQLTTLAAAIGLSFWTNLHHFGFVVVALSGVLGLLLTIARTVEFINAHYKGSITKFIKEAFILKNRK